MPTYSMVIMVLMGIPIANQVKGEGYGSIDCASCVGKFAFG